MKKIIIAGCAVAAILVVNLAQAADSDKNCIRGDAKTIDEAFTLGVKLAKSAGLELGAGENQAHIHILPEKDHDLYVVEVCPSSCESNKAGS